MNEFLKKHQPIRLREFKRTSLQTSLYPTFQTEISSKDVGKCVYTWEIY